jgi:transposase InsO family protein
MPRLCLRPTARPPRHRTIRAAEPRRLGCGQESGVWLYTEEGLCLKRMKPAGKRKAARHREERFKPTAPGQAWSMDFGADQLQDGTRFRSLTIVDVFTREAVEIEVGQSLKGDDVARTLNRLKLDRGVPKSSDGPVGVGEWREDRLLQTGQAHGQCVRGKLQRNLPGRVSGHALVRRSQGSKTPDRTLEAGIQ